MMLEELKAAEWMELNQSVALIYFLFLNELLWLIKSLIPVVGGTDQSEEGSGREGRTKDKVQQDFGQLFLIWLL